jgi:uncharacterized C2H2 Zn-finger protein
MATNLKCPVCGFEAKDEQERKDHMQKSHQGAGGASGAAGSNMSDNEQEQR